MKERVFPPKNGLLDPGKIFKENLKSIRYFFHKLHIIKYQQEKAVSSEVLIRTGGQGDIPVYYLAPREKGRKDIKL